MSEAKSSWYEEVDDVCQFTVEISADDRLHLNIADDAVQRHMGFSCTPEEYVNGTGMLDKNQSIRRSIEANMSPTIVAEIEQEIKRRIVNPSPPIPKPASPPPAVQKQAPKGWWEFWK